MFVIISLIIVMNTTVKCFLYNSADEELEKQDSGRQMKKSPDLGFSCFLFFTFTIKLDCFHF